MRRLALVTVLTLLAADPASAVLLIPISQTRTVSGSGTVQTPTGPLNDSQSFSAADFGPFNMSAQGQAAFGPLLGRGGGSQNSSVGASGVHASLSSSADALTQHQGSSSAQGQSGFSLTFTLTTAASYDLGGFTFSNAEFPGGSASAGVSLRSGGSTINSVGSQGNFHFTGMLMPGTYTLDASASASAIGSPAVDSSGSSSVLMDLVLTPEPAAHVLFGVAFLAVTRRHRRMSPNSTPE